jgi:hypothetical protein
MNYGTLEKGKPTVGETNVLSVKKKVCGHNIHILATRREDVERGSCEGRRTEQRTEK